MRRPTAKELFALATLWLLYLFLLWRDTQRSVFNFSAIPLLIIGAMITYNYFNANAYARMKTRDAENTARMQRKFGRWHRLVVWLPFLFLLSMAVLAWLIPSWGFTLLCIGFAGWLIGSLLVGVARTGPDPE